MNLKQNFLFLILLFITIPLIISGCAPDEAGWSFYKEIKLEDIHPSGVAVNKNDIWITDSTANTVALYDTTGKLIKKYDSFNKPVHPVIFKGGLLVPEFSSGKAKVIDSKGKVKTLGMIIAPERISGAGIEGTKLCFSDYGNNRIIVQQGDRAYSFGKKGSARGELLQPADAALKDGIVYVADAGNKRVQVFDLAGKSVKTIASGENISSISSLFVDNNFVFVSAFGRNDVYVYDLEGKLRQILSQKIESPTGVFSTGKYLYVSNYGGGTITIFRKK